MIKTDAVIIGAGPVGLFQLFQLGLLGVKAEVIDVLPEPGGQCAALYPDKPIYDIPGVPVCTGRELTQQLLAQARPFLRRGAGEERPANLHLGTQVSSLSAHPTGFELSTTTGQHFHAWTVFIAAGAGAFVPKALAIPGVPTDASAAALAGATGADALPPNLHHQLPTDGASAPWAGQHLVIAGGGDDALQTVLEVLAAPEAQRPARLTLLHRRDQFQADPTLDAQVRPLISQGRVTLALGVPSGALRDTSDHRLQSLTLLGADGEQTLPLDHLLVRQGLSPKLGPIADWGLHLDRKQIVVDTATFATSVEGLYAVGDINTYPGKKRLILCGFHEAALAAHAASSRLQPDAPQHLQYTTTSSLLQQRLGVK